MRWTAAVFLVSLLALGYQLHHVGLASGFVDPVGQVRAQDEAVYAHSAIRMARTGDWLTPNFLGRHALYKPPLLFWLAGLSVKLLGPSPLAARLPSLGAGALAAALVFFWLRRSSPLAAALGAVVLLVSNPVWHVVSRMCLTDALLALAITAAVFSLAHDPRLLTRRGFLGFGVSAAAAVMTKGVAGLLPLLILGLFWVVSRRGERPSLLRLVQVCLLAVLLAAPWHIYQLLIHPRWFWAEYVRGEIFTFGMAAPYQTSAENHLVFYLRRLLFADPLLCLLALAALPAAWRARRRHPTALLLAWVAVGGAAMLVFQYRNASYVSLLVPVLALLAVAYGPLFRGRRAVLATAALCLAFLARASAPDRPWGLDFRSGTTVQAAPLLDAYARRNRPNELILVSPDDEFYSAVLPLPRVRYCLIVPQDYAPAYGIDFRYLGINVSASQFIELDQWRPVFRERLKTWNLDSDEPIASVIIARSAEELAQVILSRPQTDFFLPAELRAALEPRVQTTHWVLPASPEKFFLLARVRSRTSRGNPG